jgi:hypothetical protein
MDYEARYRPQNLKNDAEYKLLVEKWGNEPLLKEIWNETHIGRGYGAACCSQCGWGTSATCMCAMIQFLKGLTQEYIDTYVKEKDCWPDIYAKEVDNLWHKHKEFYENLGLFKENRSNCPNCKTWDMTCACAKKQWIRGSIRRLDVRAMRLKS